MSFIINLKSFLKKMGHQKEAALLKVAMHILGNPNGQYILAYKDTIFKFNEDEHIIMEEAIDKIFGEKTSANIKNMMDLIDFLAERDHYLDIILGKIERDILVIHSLEPMPPNPQTSVFVKKVLKELNLSFVKTREDYIDNENLQYLGLEKIHSMPEYLYHGTAVKYADKILRFGLSPGRSPSNFPQVTKKYNDLIFLGPLSKAIFHALNTSGITDTDPIIFKVKIPDQNRLYPDYDVDRIFEQKYYKFKPKEKEKQHKGDSFSKSREAGFFAYKGRIPASHIVEILIAPNSENIDKATYSDFISITKEQLKLYLETMNEIGIGYINEIDYYNDYPKDDDLENFADDMGRTFSDLMNELDNIGPAIATYLMLTGNTRQCAFVPYFVAYYLQERDFITRVDTGAGKYTSHNDFAVYTTDKSWIAVDPTYIQFHCANNLQHAVDIAEKELNISQDELSDNEIDEILNKYFKKTLDWTEQAIKNGRNAFEVSELKNVIKNIESTEYQTPAQFGFVMYNNWTEYLQTYKKFANKILSGEDLNNRFINDQDFWIKNIINRFKELNNA